MAPRGAGKTTFVVNYILKNANHIFRRIYLVTSTPDQSALDPIRGKDNIIIGDYELLDSAISQCNILIVLDDLMQELRFNKCVQNIYSKGRHRGISLITLEQDATYSNVVERRNADYWVLFQTKDHYSLSNIYKNYCTDILYQKFDVLQF